MDTHKDLTDSSNRLQLIGLQKSVLIKFYKFLKNLISVDQKKSAKITLWLKRYLGYLHYEEKFDPSRNITYHRGQLVYVNFGFRLGSELGGNHYAIVLDTNNPKVNSTLTVVPLKTKREKATAYSKKYHVDLADAFKQGLAKKALDIIAKEASLIAARENGADTITKEQHDATLKRLNEAKAVIDFANKKLNNESVADIGQICSISKMRINHPTRNSDVLAGVLIQDDVMKTICNRIKEIYLGVD